MSRRREDRSQTGGGKAEVRAASADLTSLYERCGIRPSSKLPIDDVALAEHRIWIANGLLKMRRAGLFFGVWIDGDRIQVQETRAAFGKLPILRHLKSYEAAKLVTEFEKNPAFSIRLRDAAVRLKRGEAPDSVRERHGAIVTREAAAELFPHAAEKEIA